MHKRTPEEMMEEIRNRAQEDERIRAVWMNGSRANPNAPKDRYQDFDIVYAVTDLAPFFANDEWLAVYGERIILQIPDRMDGLDSLQKQRITYLMQFTDGNRIDLTLVGPERWKEAFLEDQMTVLLLDKDGVLPKIPQASDADYWVKAPNAKEFFNCCNEFRWVSTYVAKGVWRRELPYAHEMLDSPVRHMLLRMLSWEAGIRTDFLVSVGKHGKYLEQYLSQEEWEMYCKTYAGPAYEEIMDALFAMHRLFARSSRFVACHFGFSLDEEEENRVLSYLRGDCFQ